MNRVDAAGERPSIPPFTAPSSLPPPTQSAPVEARSLSSITTVAANPPAYPRNPTQQKLDPLTLYIVRVPGSKGEYHLDLMQIEGAPERYVD